MSEIPSAIRREANAIVRQINALTGGEYAIINVQALAEEIDDMVSEAREQIPRSMFKPFYKGQIQGLLAAGAALLRAADAGDVQ